MRACGGGARRGRGDGDAHVRRRARRPRKARRRRGAPARARARAGRAGPRARARGCGVRRGRGAGDPRRATSPMMHHAPAGQRAAPHKGGRGVGGWGEGTSPRGCKQRTPAHAEFLVSRILRVVSTDTITNSNWGAPAFAVAGGFSGARKAATEGWARGGVAGTTAAIGEPALQDFSGSTAGPSAELRRRGVGDGVAWARASYNH